MAAAAAFGRCARQSQRFRPRYLFASCHNSLFENCANASAPGKRAQLARFADAASEQHSHFRSYMGYHPLRQVWVRRISAAEKLITNRRVCNGVGMDISRFNYFLYKWIIYLTRSRFTVFGSIFICFASERQRSGLCHLLKKYKENNDKTSTWSSFFFVQSSSSPFNEAEQIRPFRHAGRKYWPNFTICAVCPQQMDGDLPDSSD